MTAAMRLDDIAMDEVRLTTPVSDAAIAQLKLGDIVYLELPSVGATFNKHDVFGTIEAVKAVSELFSPVSGEVVEVNDRLEKEPQLVNSEPYGDGWMVKMKLSDPSEKKDLLSADDYSAHIGE